MIDLKRSVWLSGTNPFFKGYYWKNRGPDKNGMGPLRPAQRGCLEKGLKKREIEEAGLKEKEASDSEKDGGIREEPH